MLSPTSDMACQEHPASQGQVVGSDHLLHPAQAPQSAAVNRQHSVPKPPYPYLQCFLART